MQLNDYLSRPDVSKTEFASRLGVARQYIHKLRVGLQKPSPRLARMIEEITEGAVSKEELRPDVWPVEQTEAA